MYSKPPRENCPTNEMIYNHIDEIWSIGLVDMVDYKTSNNKGFIKVFVIFGTFCKCLWAIPLKKMYSNKTKEFSNTLTTSKRPPVNLESDRGAEF